MDNIRIENLKGRRLNVSTNEKYKNKTRTMMRMIMDRNVQKTIFSILILIVYL